MSAGILSPPSTFTMSPILRSLLLILSWPWFLMTVYSLELA